MRLVLCAYGSVGSSVLEHVLGRTDVADVALFTHDAAGGSDLISMAERAGVYWTTKNVSHTALPFEPDIVASVYYRNVISRGVIERCGERIFNVHPSLLPRHRGCSSIPWAILEGDSVTGVSFHYIDEGIDTGPIILQSVIEIRADETQATLYGRCEERAVELWPAAFTLVKAGFPGIPQTGDGCYHRRGAPYGGVIDEDWDLDTVERFIRAMTYPPLPYAKLHGSEVRTMDEYLALSAAYKGSH